jgi:hypothetical protein
MNRGSYIVLLLCMIWILPSLSCRIIQSQENDGQVDTIFSTMITAKIAYEKSKYYNDRNKRSLKLDYFSKIKRFKQRKSIYESYIINQLKKKKTENKTILFNYISPLSSALPPCAILNNNRLLEVLLYNLNEVKSDTTLVCDL